jgi:hypothetical protein
MVSSHDGPATKLFVPLTFSGTIALADLPGAGVSEEMAAALEHAPGGWCTAWGIPFEIGDAVLLTDKPATVSIEPTFARWFVFMHTSDLRPIETNEDGFISPIRGQGRLGEHAADYVALYADGSEERTAVRRRHEIGAFTRRWGESCFESVVHTKQRPVRASHETPRRGWGHSQKRVDVADGGPWTNWLWAWENPHPEKAVTGFRFEPLSGTVLLWAISAGDASSQPLRWVSRRKARLTLPKGETFEPELDEWGLLRQIQLDMGQVISATPRPVYPVEDWSTSYNNRVPEISEREFLIEYTAHPDAAFHLSNGAVIPVAQVVQAPSSDVLHAVAPSTQRVTLRVAERQGGPPVPVKLHVHGEWGEYLAPTDRHRIINPAWFEDYSTDWSHQGIHSCTYIPGETTLDLPLGKVYVEISKGFEIRPVRAVLEVTPDKDEVEIILERVLPWRQRGWVTADTHVHFLSPVTALLEGSGEGVNVVNLLASQWGELMTNVGDFDGKTTWGSREAGGDGEYLVRVGTENRQHVMGHISLLGYSGHIIAPMTTGGPDESAIGDPIEILLTEWARKCRQQGGVVILPHFPNPRAEHAASVVSGDIDGIEMTAWGRLYDGIDPYSLSDWYRYLNCGYLVAAVGGTDKMDAITAVGTVRTYARVPTDAPFTYEAWMDAVRRAETFVTYGPLLEFAVDGTPMGGSIEISASGGTVDVTWEVASVTVPISRVELIVDGEIARSQPVEAAGASGSWSVSVGDSCWMALLVRGHYDDKPEIVAAHSSPVMITVGKAPIYAAADALTILEQIEGALAYLDTVGTRAEERAYKRMRMVLTSAHREVHNRMHQQGQYHIHSPVEDHAAHH